jgi:hypothetical protein
VLGDPPVDLRAVCFVRPFFAWATCPSCFRGAAPPVDIRAVCTVRAIPKITELVEVGDGNVNALWWSAVALECGIINSPPSCKEAGASVLGQSFFMSCFVLASLFVTWSLQQICNNHGSQPPREYGAVCLKCAQPMGFCVLTADLRIDIWNNHFYKKLIEDSGHRKIPTTTKRLHLQLN